MGCSMSCPCESTCLRVSALPQRMLRLRMKRTVSRHSSLASFFKRVLILTFKPAVQSAWREDLMSHVDFDGWQFISRPQVIGEPGMDEQYLRADKNRPIVCFGSFQDLLGVNKETGGISIDLAHCRPSCKQKAVLFHLRIPFTLFTAFQQFSDSWKVSAKPVVSFDSSTSLSTCWQCAISNFLICSRRW